MKRSSVFITVLFSLLMFQSIWNVAAAFCVHESALNKDVVNHFGHHTDELIHEKVEDKKKKVSEFIQYLEQIDLDDHSDHLPSFAHAFLVEDYAQIDWMISNYNIESQFLDWNSLYQSPHLYQPKLPPIDIPL